MSSGGFVVPFLVSSHVVSSGVSCFHPVMRFRIVLMRFISSVRPSVSCSFLRRSSFAPSCVPRHVVSLVFARLEQ